MSAAAAAARRQKAWEDQLAEEAFLNATINPIVDRVVQVKPAMPVTSFTLRTFVLEILVWNRPRVLCRLWGRQELL